MDPVYALSPETSNGSHCGVAKRGGRAIVEAWCEHSIYVRKNMNNKTRTPLWLSFLALGSLLSYRPALADDLTDLGTLPGGGLSDAIGVSADGSVVVGTSASNGRGAFWSASTGVVIINGMATVRAVSADGTTMVGIGGGTAMKWTAAGGGVSLGTLGGQVAHAYAVSANGDVVVGESEYTLDGYIGENRRAFRWTAGGGMVSLGTLNGGAESRAYGVSADGSVVIGVTHDGPMGYYYAYRWTEAGGMVKIGGPDSYAFGISGNGSVVVGHAPDGAQDGAAHAFRWTAGEGMVSLGPLNGGGFSSAKATSADGRVIVGNANDGSAGNAQRGFRWSAASGMQSVEHWLQANGVTVGSGLATKTAMATNADGSVVVGQLQSGRAYIARLSLSELGEASPLGSGVIDVQSFSQSLQSAGRPHTLGNIKTGLVLHGLNGAPMRNLLKAGQQSVWVSGDLGRQDHAAHDGRVGAGEAGYAYGLSDRLMLKLAVGKTYSEQQLLHDGATTLRGTYLLPELIYALPWVPWFATISGYYNVGTADVRRGYLNADVQDASRASTSARTSALRLRLDWVDALRLGGLSFSPYASVSQVHSKIGEVTESGGGFPVRWKARSETDTQTRLGTDASYALGHGMNLVGRLEAVHRLESAGSDVSGEVLGLGGFHLAGEANKRNWLRAGLGIEGRAGPGSFSVMASATTEAQTPSAWVFAQYRIRF